MGKKVLILLKKARIFGKFETAKTKNLH